MEGGTDFSTEIYRQYGLDLMEMKKKGEEHDWGIREKEKAEELTGNMAGFGMDQSQRIVTDFDKDYRWTLVRRYKKDTGRTVRPVKD